MDDLEQIHLPIDNPNQIHLLVGDGKIKSNSSSMVKKATFFFASEDAKVG
jgi:hypothetical protein